MADIEPISIPLILKGLPEVERSLKSIRDLMIEIEVESSKAAVDSSKNRIGVLKGELQQRQKLISSASKRVDHDLDGSLGGGARRTVSRSPSSGANTSGFMELSGLDKSIGGMKKFASGVGIAAAGFLALKAGVEIATEALTQFGSFLLSDVIKPAFALETFATQVSNTTKGEISAQEIMDKSRAIQVKYNIDAQEAAEAAASFGDKTGSVASGFDVLNDVVPIVKAFGGDLKEAMDSTAALYNKMTEIDPNTTMNDVGKVLLAQLGQGQVKGGKFTAKEIAGLGGELTKGAGSLSGSAGKRLSDISAALQAGGLTGKADVSMTALNAFLTEMPLLAKAGKVAGGKKELNKQGQIEDLGSAIKRVLIASKGDATKVRGMGFGEGSGSFLAQFMPGFQEAIKKGKKPEEAAAEAVAAFERIRKAIATEAEVREAAAKVMATSGQKWETAINVVKDKLLAAIGEDVKTKVDEFVSAIPQIASAAVTMAGAISSLADFILGFVKVLNSAKGQGKVYKEKGLGAGIKNTGGSLFDGLTDFLTKFYKNPERKNDSKYLIGGTAAVAEANQADKDNGSPTIPGELPIPEGITPLQSDKDPDVIVPQYAAAAKAMDDFTAKIQKSTEAVDELNRKRPGSER